VRGGALDAIADRLLAEVDELADLIVREVGKPRREARGEARRCVDVVRYFAGSAHEAVGERYAAADAGAVLMTQRRPLGVVAAVTPWNFPALIPLWKVAPALVCGNAVILKPSPLAAGVADWVTARCTTELPPDTLQVLHGGAESVEALVREPIDGISFTGSTAVGRRVAAWAAARGVEAQCEMGGINPSVVLPDADVVRAAKAITAAVTGYAGQKCTATRRIVAVGSVFDPLVAALVDAFESAPCGDPSDDRTVVGPLINAAACERAAAALDASGGTVLTGGLHRSSHPGVLAPTLVEVPDRQDALRNNEVFAPIAAICRATDIDQAVAVANEGPGNLAASVFTSSLGSAIEVVNRLAAGVVRVNAPTSGVDFHTPFGGSGGAGLGVRELGHAALDFYGPKSTIGVWS